MAGISINLLSNVREAVRGVDDVADALGDAQDRLHDLTKEGDTATDRMADDFREFGRKAEREADAVKDAMRQAFKDGRAAVKDSTDDATKDVKKFGDTAKDELRDSAREGAQSFTGEFSDVQDVLQETVANLGPAGIVGAAAIGAIIATATASVEAWDEKIQGIKDATAEMWSQAAAEGQAYLDQDAIQAEAHRVLWDEAYDAEFKAAQEAGIKKSDLALAIAEGEGEAYDRVHQQLKDQLKERLDFEFQHADKFREMSATEQAEYSRTTQALSGVVQELDAKAKAVENGKQKAQEAQEISNTLHQQERDQIERTNKAAQERYEGLAELYGHPIKAKVEVEVDTSAWDRWSPRRKDGWVNARVSQPV